MHASRSEKISVCPEFYSWEIFCFKQKEEEEEEKEEVEEEEEEEKEGGGGGRGGGGGGEEDPSFYFRICINFECHGE